MGKEEMSTFFYVRAGFLREQDGKHRIGMMGRTGGR